MSHFFDLVTGGLGQRAHMTKSNHEKVANCVGKAIKNDKQDAATTLWTCLAVLNCLKISMYPFLPFSSAKLHRMLGFKGALIDTGWDWKSDALKCGQYLEDPKPLFVKLDEKTLKNELERLNQ